MSSAFTTKVCYHFLPLQQSSKVQKEPWNLIENNAKDRREMIYTNRSRTRIGTPQARTDTDILKRQGENPYIPLNCIVPNLPLPLTQLYRGKPDGYCQSPVWNDASTPSTEGPLHITASLRVLGVPILECPWYPCCRGWQSEKFRNWCYRGQKNCREHGPALVMMHNCVPACFT